MTTQTDVFDATRAKAELNQYWYSDDTRRTLVREVADHATRCAFLSTPSLFFTLRDAALDDDDDGNDGGGGERTHTNDDNTTTPPTSRRQRLRALWHNSYLFEWDAQWSAHARVVHYDYRAPTHIPVQHLGAFDYVVADPPFITEDVWAAYVTTAKLLLCNDNNSSSNNGSAAASHGKVLFTSVLENHTMLERLMNEALYIAAYWPAVCGLTYQYVCFVSYEPTQLRTRNTELPAPSSDDERRLLASIAMANDLRSSEKSFALQLASRDRHGEVALPTHADATTATTHDTSTSTSSNNDNNAVDWQRVPLTQMPWGYIPAHLQPYANKDADDNDNKNTNTPSNNNNDDDQATTTRCAACYACAHTLRTRLDTFKSGIDALQRTLTRELQLRQQIVKLRKCVADTTTTTTTTTTATTTTDDDVDDNKSATQREQLTREVAAVKAAREQQLSCLSDVAARIVADEEQLAHLRAAVVADAANDNNDDNDDGDSNKTTTTMKATMTADAAADTTAVCAYAHVMQDCIDAYSAVELRKAALQELAADATRKYKSPLFHRMQELLQLMKQLKKRAPACAATSA